jgi:trehalose 6-phosphate synthase/phosphatase
MATQIEKSSNSQEENSKDSKSSKGSKTYPRLLVVSNRLPITISKNEKGEFVYKLSSGGLVAGLEGVKKKLSFIWIGWTGCEIPEDKREEVSEKLRTEYSCVPVFMSDRLADEHYNGFSNGILWPLFHYLLGDQPFSQKQWNSYCLANEQFAKVVLSVWKEGDLIWVHDFHLMKLPEILRKSNPNVRIGFFLHIPFPSSEIFQVLPVRKPILHGLLNCDLLGFHTYDYVRHFLSACTRILGLETTPGGVQFEGRFVPTSVFPIGIDPDKFVTRLKSPEVQTRLAEYQQNFEGKYVLIGVDRLDYIKGIPHKLKALELFFQKYPQFQSKVVLIQVAVPSRTDVEEYKRLKAEVDGLVGRINGTYGSFNYHPIQYLFKSVTFDDLCAMYRLSDVMLITSTRDGMNLVSQEFIACQEQKHGVLILSEFAGSANALSGSLLVNPYNPSEVADAIYEALTMSPQEKAAKFQHLWNFINKHTATFWGESFIKSLQKACTEADRLRKTPRLDISILQAPLKKSQKRLFIFSTDHGVLIPQRSGAPFLAAPSPRIIQAIEKLASNDMNKVYLISGRDRLKLYHWFGQLDVSLVAEHGYFILDKCSGSNEWETPNPSNFEWKVLIKPIFEYFKDRTPGSYLEEKETSLTWQYRNTERDFGAFRAQELLSHLGDSTFQVDVVKGDKEIEVRPYELNYTRILKTILTRQSDFDFVLYFGPPCKIESDRLDSIFTVGVGSKNQKYYLNDCNELAALIEEIFTYQQQPSN